MATTPRANQIKNTPAGNISATNVQAALNELDTEKLAIAWATVAELITGTEATKPINSAVLAGWTSYNPISVTLSAGSYTLAGGTLVKAFMDTSATITANATIAITGSNLKELLWHFKVNGTVDLDFTGVTGVVFEQSDVAQGRWDSTLKILTLTGVTANEFELVGEQRGTVWKFVTNKFV